MPSPETQPRGQAAPLSPAALVGLRTLLGTALETVAVAAVTAVLVAAVAGDEALAQGCAMCKTAIGGPADPLARGINTSILFMMAVPFALFAVVGGWLTYSFWGAASGQVEGADDAAAGERSENDLVYTEREGAR